MNPSLLALFEEWRHFEQSPLGADGVPDYRAARLPARAEQLAVLRQSLEALPTDGWSVAERVDQVLLRAEMQGLDFHLRVLQPWRRDPAFYRSLWTEQSDTPAHEGPSHHALIELWTYPFPLTLENAARLQLQIDTIAPLLAQARENLDSDAADLWNAGIPTLRNQIGDLHALAGRVAHSHAALRSAAQDAAQATQDFVHWLEDLGATKTAPSGLGKANYTWYQQQVHQMPLTWEEEVVLLRRELDRAHASLRLEEHRNRHLPALTPIASAQEYQARASSSVAKYMAFLREREILRVKDYMEPALRDHTGRYQPPETCHFFGMARQHEPMALWCHWHHWFEIAQMREEPHPNPIRRGALLYNIFDSRAEGLATAMEEMMMHAGLYDDNPRAREVVWILLAQRAARGLASLYLHANEFSLQQAQDFHVANTPRGWMRADLPLLQFEQHLYLRQPGYGTSYITGKALIEQLLADYARQCGESFRLADFFEAVHAAGIIPVSLVRWEMTGLNDAVQKPAD